MVDSNPPMYGVAVVVGYSGTYVLQKLQRELRLEKQNERASNDVSALAEAVLTLKKTNQELQEQLQELQEQLQGLQEQLQGL